MKIKLLGTVIAGALAVVGTASAQNLLVNGSFETPGSPGQGSSDPTYTSSGFGTIPGWFGGVASDSGSQSVADKTGGAHTASYDGGFYAYMMVGDSQAGNYANQTTSTIISSAGETFNLTFGASANGSSDGNWSATTASVHYFVYSGANVLTGHIITQGEAVLAASPGEGNGLTDIPIWSTTGASAVAGAIDVGQPIGIALENSSGWLNPNVGAVHSWVLVDGVSLTVAPEPTTATLLGFAGLSALLALRRRRA